MSGAVLAGPAGVGKTLLARTAAEAGTARFHTVTGTVPERMVPFGAFRGLVRPAEIGRPAEVLRAARRSLTGTSEGSAADRRRRPAPGQSFGDAGVSVGVEPLSTTDRHRRPGRAAASRRHGVVVGQAADPNRRRTAGQHSCQRGAGVGIRRRARRRHARGSRAPQPRQPAVLAPPRLRRCSAARQRVALEQRTAALAGRSRRRISRQPVGPCARGAELSGRRRTAAPARPGGAGRPTGSCRRRGSRRCFVRR